MFRTWLAALALGAVAGLSLAPAALAQDARLIVKLQPDGAKSALTPKARIAKAAATAGISAHHLRAMSIGADVIAVAGGAGAVDLAVAALAADPDVAFVQVDRRRHAAAVNDAAAQPYLSSTAGGIDATAAWNITHGSSSIVVAVVDTGVRPHAGMAGRLLPGYDMVSDPARSNDGDGRDPDAYDPGDFVPASAATADCPESFSSWHGTSVAGVIGANTNDGQWTAGIDWAARILPVRVLGQCGGYDSDVVDGIAWAAGLSVPGVPDNPTPAHVINLSLGGAESCPPIYPLVIDAAYARGVTRAIVAAAGNDSADVANFSPASCGGLIAVASTTLTGKLADYSNFGTGITISAPGGGFAYQFGIGSIAALSNFGRTTPGADAITHTGGTSLAAPMVSGAISLMLSVAPDLTPTQVRSILTSTAKPFPAGSDCSPSRCGAGIVSADAAVRAAQAGAIPASSNYQGLWWRAPAGSESGWGLNVAHQGGVIFATWFTYDATGKAWWLSMTANETSANVFSGTLYQTHGPSFAAVPFSPAAVTATAVGSGTLAFSDDANGTFTYTVNGITQTKAITREVFGPLPVCTFGSATPLAQATNYQDLWWAAPAAVESGWGVNFTQQGDVIFATWFTYDTDGTPLWLSATANQSSAGVYTGTLYRTTGPSFSASPFNPQQVVATPVGTLTLTFDAGDHATFAYIVNGISQSKSITREVFRAPGTLCR